MGDLAKLDATMQLRWQTIEANAHTIEARRNATIVPAAYSPSTTGRRAVEMLARSPDGTLAGVNLEGTLGEGGMGIVRLGTQRALGRKVAVKTLRNDVRDEGAILKLLREAWITGALEHPNILPIHDLSLDDEGLPLVVLKLIEGSDWGDVISDSELAHERFDVDFDFIKSTRRIDNAETCRFRSCQVQIALANTFKKVMLLLLNSVWRAARAGPLHANFHRSVQQDGEIWPGVTVHPVGQQIDCLHGKSSTTALVGATGVGEPVTDDPFSRV